jgi:hypothetical protein
MVRLPRPSVVMESPVPSLLPTLFILVCGFLCGAGVIFFSALPPPSQESTVRLQFLHVSLIVSVFLAYVLATVHLALLCLYCLRWSVMVFRIAS